MLLCAVLKEKLTETFPQFVWTIGQKEGAIDVILTSRAGGRCAEVLFRPEEIHVAGSGWDLDQMLRTVASRSIQHWSKLR